MNKSCRSTKLICLLELTVSLLTVPARAQTASIKPSLDQLKLQETPEKAAEFVWQTVLKPCQRPGESEPTLFYYEYTNERQRDRAVTVLTLREFAGPFSTSKLTVYPASVAEKRNTGLVWTATARMTSKAFRVTQLSSAQGRKNWSEWFDSDMTGVKTGIEFGAPLLTLKRYQSGETSADLMKEHIDALDPIDKVYVPVSCPVVTSSNPFSEWDGTAKAAALATQAAQARQEAESRLRNATATLTADEFEPRFVEDAKQRIAELGLPFSQFEIPIGTVINLVHTCASLTAADFANSFIPRGFPELRKIGNGKYGDCNTYYDTTDRLFQGARDKPPGTPNLPVFTIFGNHMRHWDKNQKIWTGPKYQVEIYVDPVPRVLISPGAPIEIRAKYLILAAEIVDSSSAAVPVPSPTGGVAQSPRPQSVPAASTDAQASSDQSGRLLCSGSVIRLDDATEVTVQKRASILQASRAGEYWRVDAILYEGINGNRRRIQGTLIKGQPQRSCN